jgi:hypothetical protein
VSGRRTRPGSIASPDGAAETVRLRFALLRLYDADADFMAGLRQLASEPVDALACYRFAREFGLDRIGPEVPGWADEPTLEWVARATLATIDHPGLAAVIEWVESARAAGHALRFPTSTGIGVAAPETPEPVTVTVRWDPQSETRAEAERRAEADVHAALAAIEQAATAAGLRWSDSRAPDIESRDLDWLFLRLRHRLSWQKLAARVSEEPDMVGPAVREIAKRAGVRVR